MLGREMKKKFVNLYMKMAKTVAECNTACYSRKIGAVIVSDYHRVLGVGYNGPPRGTPHMDTEEALYEYFWPQLTNEEQRKLLKDSRSAMGLEGNLNTKEHAESALKHKVGCKTCPRRFINAGPGQRSELCSCVGGHCEVNAIINAQSDLTDSTMFCWCGVPCLQCTGQIINAGIKEVNCLKDSDYHSQSRFLFKKAGIKITEHDQNSFS